MLPVELKVTRWVAPNENVGQFAMQRFEEIGLPVACVFDTSLSTGATVLANG